MVKKNNKISSTPLLDQIDNPDDLKFLKLEETKEELMLRQRLVT